ncbi:MAG: MATE family efflux transporter, partial [Eubacteriales bacterium]
MKIQLSDHFTTGRLLRFALPSIVMMIFTSFYGVVDGIFVSNFTGSTAFASLNLVWPYIMILGGVGFILGVGGTALVSYQMGTGDRKLANRTFSLIVYAGIVVGLLLTLFGELTMAPVCRLMGASEEMLPYCVKYGRVMLLGIIPFTLQNMFQSFLVAAEKPRLGLWVTVAAGITNMGLDYLFMGPFHWGVVGAAWATMLSECVGGLIPLLYFCFPNSSLYRLGRTRWDG